MGKVIYNHPHCYLHHEAASKLEMAHKLAVSAGFGMRIFDAFRPTEAQWKLWEICPDPMYVANPERGSAHSRGIAVDLTLIDSMGNDLDMGTPFDDFTTLSHHATLEISPLAQKNRAILLGIMTAAGWDLYLNEWWHYQLFQAPNYPLLSDKESPRPMMI